MSFLKTIKDWFSELRGKGPAAAVAVTIDLSVARDNKPWFLEAGAIYVEKCDGDLYARVNGPNGDGMNLQYIKIIRYPVTSLWLTNTAQAGKSARLLLMPTGMDADPPAGAGLAKAHNIYSAEGATDISTSSALWEVMTGMQITQTFGANRILVFFSAGLTSGTAGQVGQVAIDVDGTLYSLGSVYIATAGIDFAGILFYTGTLTAGSHTITVYWRVYPSGTIYNYAGSYPYDRRRLIVVEILA